MLKTSALNELMDPSPVFTHSTQERFQWWNLKGLASLLKTTWATVTVSSWS